jgi:hypothetical protein
LNNGSKRDGCKHHASITPRTIETHDIEMLVVRETNTKL